MLFLVSVVGNSMGNAEWVYVKLGYREGWKISE